MKKIVALLIVVGALAPLYAEKQFHPGHYVAISPGETAELAGIRHLDDPAVQGVNKRYHWRQLEPEKDVYDFSMIEADLEFLASLNKQLVVFLVDSAFWIRGAMPDYMKRYEVQNDGGYACARWEPEVVERQIALARALGNQFDEHPNFEGIAIQESSIWMPQSEFSRFNYTPERYRDALIAILEGMQATLPHSRVFWYSNFLPENDGHLRQVADALVDDGVLMGGPDILPHRRWIRWESYPMYDEYRDRLILFCSAQDDSYRHHVNDIRLDTQEEVPPEGYLTMEEIFLFARDELHVSYLFWTYYYGVEAGERSYDDAIKVIRKYPDF